MTGLEHTSTYSSKRCIDDRSVFVASVLNVVSQQDGQVCPFVLGSSVRSQSLEKPLPIRHMLSQNYDTFRLLSGLTSSAKPNPNLLVCALPGISTLDDPSNELLCRTVMSCADPGLLEWLLDGLECPVIPDLSEPSSPPCPFSISSPNLMFNSFNSSDTLSCPPIMPVLLATIASRDVRPVVVIRN
jgi:hypothetical protein